MATTWMTYEGGIAGTAGINGTNGEQFIAPGGGAITYDSAHAFDGTKALKIAPASGQVADVIVKSGLNSPQLGMSVAFWFDTISTSDEEVWRIEDTANTRILGLVRAGSGRLSLTDKNGSTPRLWIGTANPPVSQWIVGKVWLQIGGTATTGTVNAAFYTASGTLLAATSGGMDAPFTTSAANLGTVNIGRFYIGRTGTQTATDPRWYDTLGYDAAATGLLPNYSGPPTATGTQTDNVARVAISATGGVPPFTYSITQTAGTTTAPVADGTGAWLITKHATDTLTYRMTVTDSASATASSVTSVLPRPKAANWPKAPSGALPSSVWA